MGKSQKMFRLILKMEETELEKIYITDYDGVMDNDLKSLKEIKA